MYMFPLDSCNVKSRSPYIGDVALRANYQITNGFAHAHMLSLVVGELAEILAEIGLRLVDRRHAGRAAWGVCMGWPEDAKMTEQQDHANTGGKRDHATNNQRELDVAPAHDAALLACRGVERLCLSEQPLRLVLPDKDTRARGW